MSDGIPEGLNPALTQLLLDNPEIAPSKPADGVPEGLNSNLAAMLNSDAPQANVDDGAEPLKGWVQAVQPISDRFQLGLSVFPKMAAGLEMIATDTAPETMQANLQNEELEQIQKRKEEYINDNVHVSLAGNKFGPADLPGLIIEQTPILGASVIGGGLGMAAAGVVAAPAIPFALVGAAITAGVISLGSSAYDLRIAGATREAAANGGLIIGLATGILEAIGFKGVGTAAAKGVKIGFMGVSKKVMGRRLQVVARKILAASTEAASTEIGTELTETLVEDTVAYVMSKTQNGMKEVSPKEFQDELVKHLVQAGVTAGITGGFLGGAGTTLGVINGQRIKQYLKVVRAKKLEIDQLNLADAGLEEETETDPKKLAAAKARAKRAFSGFAEVRDVPSEEEAQKNLKAAIKIRDEVEGKDARAIAQADVDIAKAVLQESRLQDRLERVEEAITTPKGDLAGVILLQQEKVKLEGRLAKARQSVARTVINKERQAQQRKIDKLRGEIRADRAEAKRAREALPEIPIAANPDTVSTTAPRDLKEFAKAARDQTTKELLDLVNDPKASFQKAKIAVAELQARRAEAEGISPGATGEASTAIKREQLEVLREEQSINDLTLELFDENLVTAEDVAVTKPQLTEGRIANLMKAAIRTVERAFKLGQIDQRQTARKLRSMLRRLIQATRLPTLDKKTLVAKVDTFDTLEVTQRELPKLMSRIEETFQKRRKEAAVTDLNALMGRITAKKTDKSKFPTAEESLFLIKNAVKDFDTVIKAMLHFDKLISESAEFSDYELAQFALLDLFPVPIEEMTADQVEEIIDQTVELIELGTNKSLREIERRLAVVANTTKRAFHNMTTPLKGKTATNVKERSAEWKRKLNSVITAPLSVWSLLMSLTTQLGQATDMAGLFPVKRILSNYLGRVQKWERTYKQILADKGVDEKTYKKFQIEAGKKAENIRYGIIELTEIESDEVSAFEDDIKVQKADRDAAIAEGDEDAIAVLTDEIALAQKELAAEKFFGRTVMVDLKQTKEDGDDVGLDYDYWQLIQIRNYLLDKDPDAQRRLRKGNGFSTPDPITFQVGKDIEGNPIELEMVLAAGTSTLEQVELALKSFDSNALKIADGMKEFYKEFAPEVDAASMRRFGRHIIKNDTYGGPLLSGASRNEFMGEQFRRATNRSGSVFAREGSDKIVKIRPADDVLTDHITKFSRDAAFFEFEFIAPRVFEDGKIKDFIIRKFGANTHSIIMRYIADLVTGSHENHDEASKWFAKIRRAAFSFFLGAKPEQYLKQLTSFVYALNFASPLEMIEGYQFLVATPGRAIKLMNKSPILKARGQLMDPDMQPGLKGSMNRISTLMMTPTRTGDVHGIYFAAFPVLLKVLKETGSEEAAIAAFEDAFDTTQSSGSLDELPAIFRGSALARMFVVFTQQPTRQVNAITQSWIEMRAGKKKGFSTWTNRVGVAYLGAALYQLVGALALAPFMDDDDFDERIATVFFLSFLGPYAGMAYFGAILTPIWLTNMEIIWDAKLQVFTPEFLATDTAGSAVKAGTAITKILDDDSEGIWEAITGAVEFFGRYTGFPTNNILRMNPFTDGDE